MAQATPSEGAPLLGRKRTSLAPHHQQYASSSSSRLDEGDEAESVFSHVSLDTTPTYGRLVASHVLSLLPGLSLQLATIMLAYHAPCHIHRDSQDRRSDQRLCRQLLSDWMSLTAFTLGLVSWLAAYSFRPALWKVVEWCSSLLQWSIYPRSQEEIGEGDCERGSASRRQQSSSTIATLFFVLLRTAVLESLRMFSVMVVNAVLFAGLAHLQDQGSVGKGIKDSNYKHWLLEWYDPRFTVGLWVAIGWCLTEFVVSTFQMIDRLSLYKPLFQDAVADEVADTPAATGLTFPVFTFSESQTFTFSESQTGAGYTSDSATTVRAAPVAPLPTNGEENGEQQQEQLQSDALKSEASISPRMRLLHARRLASGAPEGGIESGFSLAGLENEANEQEMNRLKEQLEDEMDVLLKAQMRDELLQTLGQPLTEVPMVLCALWRIDGWLWNLGATLLVSASVTLAQGPLTEQIPRLFPPFHLVRTTLLVLIALHTLLTSLWTTLLPTFGFAFVTYTSMLAGLGLCVSALGRWGLLV